MIYVLIVFHHFAKHAYKEKSKEVQYQCAIPKLIPSSKLSLLTGINSNIFALPQKFQTGSLFLTRDIVIGMFVNVCSFLVISP